MQRLAQQRLAQCLEDARRPAAVPDRRRRRGRRSAAHRDGGESTAHPYRAHDRGWKGAAPRIQSVGAGVFLRVRVPLHRDQPGRARTGRLQGEAFAAGCGLAQRRQRSRHPLPRPAPRELPLPGDRGQWRRCLESAGRRVRLHRAAVLLPDGLVSRAGRPAGGRRDVRRLPVAGPAPASARAGAAAPEPGAGARHRRAHPRAGPGQLGQDRVSREHQPRDPQSAQWHHRPGRHAARGFPGRARTGAGPLAQRLLQGAGAGVRAGAQFHQAGARPRAAARNALFARPAGGGGRRAVPG